MEAMKADADLLESQAKLCNDRKNFAKQAGDLSVKLFFKLFVKVSIYCCICYKNCSLCYFAIMYFVTTMYIQVLNS